VTYISLTLLSRRNPRPGRRRLDHIRRAAGGQNVRSSLGNHSEHEQSRGLALQQSQEAHIGTLKYTFTQRVREEERTFLLPARPPPAPLNHLNVFCPQSRPIAVRWRIRVCLTGASHFKKGMRESNEKSLTNCNEQDFPHPPPPLPHGQFHHFSCFFYFIFLLFLILPSLQDSVKHSAAKQGPSGNIVQPQ